MLFESLFKNLQTLSYASLGAKPVSVFDKVDCIFLRLLVFSISENETFLVCKERPDPLEGVLVSYRLVKVNHVEPVGPVGLRDTTEDEVIARCSTLRLVTFLALCHLVLSILHICILNVLRMNNRFFKKNQR
jgi:hypothetical protein